MTSLAGGVGNKPSSLEIASQWATIAAALLGVIAIGGAWLQLRGVKKQLGLGKKQRKEALSISGAQALLATGAALAGYEEISINLRPGGVWHDSSTHPDKHELPYVEQYLSMFEIIWYSLTSRILKLEAIDYFYGYRIANIWANRRIVNDKLQNSHTRAAWEIFIALTCVIEVRRGQRFRNHSDKWIPVEAIKKFDEKVIRQHARLALPPED